MNHASAADRRLPRGTDAIPEPARAERSKPITSELAATVSGEISARLDDLPDEQP